MRFFLAVLLAFPCFAAQAWPDKPVRIVVAYPPGGGIAVMARQIAEKLGTRGGGRDPPGREYDHRRRRRGEGAGRRQHGADDHRRDVLDQPAPLRKTAL